MLKNERPSPTGLASRRSILGLASRRPLIPKVDEVKFHYEDLEKCIEWFEAYREARSTKGRTPFDTSSRLIKDI